MYVHAGLCVTSITSLGVGIFSFAASIVENIKINLHSIQEDVKNKRDRLQILKRWSHFIRLHMDAKQLSKRLIFNVFI